MPEFNFFFYLKKKYYLYKKKAALTRLSLFNHRKKL